MIKDRIRTRQSHGSLQKRGRPFVLSSCFFVHVLAVRRQPSSLPLPLSPPLRVPVCVSVARERDVDVAVPPIHRSWGGMEGVLFVCLS
jgi:hypothetical protein